MNSPLIRPPCEDRAI
jgi:hypothetical protein